MFSLSPDVLEQILARLSVQDETSMCSVAKALGKIIRPLLMTRGYLKIREKYEPGEAVCCFPYFSTETTSCRGWDPESLRWHRLPTFNFLPHDTPYPYTAHYRMWSRRFRAIASHKGLVWVRDQGRYYVCNPLTRDYTAVPAPDRPVNEDYSPMRASDDLLGFTLFFFSHPYADSRLWRLRSSASTSAGWDKCWPDDGADSLERRPGGVPLLLAGAVLYWWARARSDCASDYGAPAGSVMSELMAYDTDAAGSVPWVQAVLVLYPDPDGEELDVADVVAHMHLVEADGRAWAVRLVANCYDPGRGASPLGLYAAHVEVFRVSGTPGCHEQVFGQKQEEQVCEALERPFPTALGSPRSMRARSWTVSGAGSTFCLLALDQDASRYRVLQLDVLTREWAVGEPSLSPGDLKTLGQGPPAPGSFQLSRAAKVAYLVQS